jgi:CubicO group peptidase (beta-lactamase class C family)
LPVLAAAIVTSKGLIASGAVGVRKYGTNSPVTVNDQFHLGSDTKAMTVTMLATLVEEGKLAWTTTIEQAFSELASKMNPVTVKSRSNNWSPLGLADTYNLAGSPGQQRAA